MEVAGPIAKDAIDKGAQIELGAESVEHHMTINARGGEGSLVDLESVGALRRLHCRVDGGVKLDGRLVNLDWLEGPGNEHIVRFGAVEPDMAMAVRQQPDNNNSEGVWRRPKEHGTGRR